MKHPWQHKCKTVCIACLLPDVKDKRNNKSPQDTTIELAVKGINKKTSNRVV